jgi:phosphoribosylformylglycinamidine cyclo-ligase
MNIDDMACVGCTENIILSSTIGRNKSLIPSEVIKEIILYTQQFIEELADHGVKMTLAGGETADVGDIVRTIDVGITAFGRIKREQVVDISVQPGDVIVGLASYGQAHYESSYNGGMGSNGLTSARHDVLAHKYAAQYPESFDPNIDHSLVYCGSRELTEEIEIGGTKTTIGKLILSPTRTYIPIVHKMLSAGIKTNGIIHCSGGAQTKVMKFVKGVKIIKNKLFPMPTLFQIIEKESGTPRKEMYEVFNMGHRLECYVHPSFADEIISIASSFGVDAKVIGRVEASAKAALEITDDKATYHY